VPVALYFFLSSMYFLMIPTGESPDEPSHLQCIEQVSLYHRLPQVVPTPTGEWWSREHVISGYLCWHMPLYYVTSSGLHQVVATVSNAPLHFEFPPNNPDWGKSPAMFTHPLKTSWLDLEEPFPVIALRVESMLLGLVALWAAARVARRVFPDAPIVPYAAAMLIAGWPQFLFMSRAINNDTLATALSLVVLIIALEIGTPGRFVWASLLACLAVLAKLTMLFVIPTLAAIFFLELLWAGEQRRQYFWPGLVSVLPLVSLVLIIALQPTIRTHFEQNLASFGSALSRAYTIPYWLDVLQLTLGSGWVRFGWMNVPAPDWQAYLWWASTGLAVLVGLYVGYVAPDTKNRRLFLLIIGIWSAGVLLTYARINLNRFQPQFRYAFPLLPIWAAFAAAGLLAPFRRTPRLQLVVFAVLTIVMLLVNVWLLAAIVVPAYA
jgi:hypothetical protein